MSTFSCPVARVATVDNHPNADRLSNEIAIGLDRCVNAKTISERDNNGPH